MSEANRAAVTPSHRWFDAHLDLAYLAELGRDMHAPLDDCRGRLLPAAVTLRSLADGGVAACLATVFTEPLEPGAVGDQPAAYPAGDAAAAWRCGMRQLKLYRAWLEGGAVRALRAEGAGPLRLGVLVENADPIESPDELGPWIEGGVVAVGLTWARPGRYAHGHAVPSDGPGGGLTDLGRAMVRAIDAAGIVHDVSHLNDRSLDGLLEHADGRVMASHSNARSGLPGSGERHLTNEAIAEIARRDGVIGINLFGRFLTSEDRSATVDDAADQVERVAAAAGGRRFVGLGSDMDGGFAADRLPEGLRRPADLERLAAALSARGWTRAEVDGFRFGNWSRFWGL